ncbi:MAG: glycoside hydrolase family 1 protein [Candidatus Saccharibacteria bacterium]
MQKNKKPTFPKSFFWGVAVSAHQVEGGNYNQWSVWELENAKVLATQAPHRYNSLPKWDEIEAEAKNPDNYISGQASDHYNRHDEDFALLEELNMNAFRFSIEWSRIEPEEGAWNAAAIDYYKKYIKNLKSRGIEPIATMFHFTLPVWFAKKGGFTKRSNVEYFVRFVEKVMSEMGAHLRYIITINEPSVYANESYLEGNWPPNATSKLDFWLVLNNLAYAHKKSRQVIKQIQRRARVSVAHNSSYVYAGDDAWLSRKFAALMQWFKDDYFLQKVARHCDFLGINYYFSDRVYGYRVHNPEKELSDLGWDVSPENLEFALIRLWNKYKLPIMITENGIADRDDELRQQWILKTINAMQNAINKDVKLLGYLHWSLIDNFEWAYGKWPRFGLASVDYNTFKRELRPSAKGFAKAIKYIRENKSE